MDDGGVEIIQPGEEEAPGEPNITNRQNNEQIVAFKGEMRTERFSSPIPPPDILARYQEIIPDSPERILVMVEKQMAHRHALENKTIDSDVWQSKVGLFMGYSIVLIVIVGGMALIVTGMSVAGITTLVLALGGLASTFIYADRKKDRELKEHTGTPMASDKQIEAGNKNDEEGDKNKEKKKPNKKKKKKKRR